MKKEEYERLLANGWIEDKDFVFISYASKDYEQAYQTVLALRAKGINVYIDVEFRENQSHNWLENFQKRIIEDPGCCGIVTFLSINYLRSYACLMEQLANWSHQLIYEASKPHPVFYIALEPEMCSSQQMMQYVYACRKESTLMPSSSPTEEECAVLERLILDMDPTAPSYGKNSKETVDEFLKRLKKEHNRHTAALKMYELIFEKSTFSFQAFNDPESCAELLFRNFTNNKNKDIDLVVDEELAQETMRRLREAGLAPDLSPAPAPQAAPAPAPASIPAASQAAPKSGDFYPVPKPVLVTEAPRTQPKPVLVTEMPQTQPKRRGRPPKGASVAGDPTFEDAPAETPKAAAPAVTAIRGALPRIAIGEIRRRFMTEAFCLKVGELRKGKDNLPYGGKGALDYGMAAILGGCNSVKQPWQINYYNFAVANMEKKTGAKLSATWTWSSNCRKVLGLEKSGIIPVERDNIFASLPEDTLFGDIVAAFEKGDFPYDTVKNDVVVECLRLFAALL